MKRHGWCKRDDCNRRALVFLQTKRDESSQTRLSSLTPNRRQHGNHPERGSGKSLLPGSGLTCGLPLPTCPAGESRPLFRFISDTDGVLCVPEKICTRALRHTRIHRSVGAIIEIGTRSISSSTSAEILCGQLLRWFCSLSDYPHLRSKVKSGEFFQSLVMWRARRDPRTPAPPERTRETRINTGDFLFSGRVVVILVHSRPAAYSRISLAPPLHP